MNSSNAASVDEEKTNDSTVIRTTTSSTLPTSSTVLNNIVGFNKTTTAPKDIAPTTTSSTTSGLYDSYMNSTTSSIYNKNNLTAVAVAIAASASASDNNCIILTSTTTQNYKESLAGDVLSTTTTTNSSDLTMSYESPTRHSKHIIGNECKSEQDADADSQRVNLITSPITESYNTTSTSTSAATKQSSPSGITTGSSSTKIDDDPLGTVQPIPTNNATSSTSTLTPKTMRPSRNSNTNMTSINNNNNNNNNSNRGLLRRSCRMLRKSISSQRDIITSTGTGTGTGSQRQMQTQSQNVSVKSTSSNRLEIRDQKDNSNNSNHSNNTTTSSTKNTSTNNMKRMLSKYPRIGIVIPSIIVCTIICSIGMSMIGYNVAIERSQIETEVKRLAIDTGNFFADELDKATLPLFSLAQFATEIDLFYSLPGSIGQGGRVGSVPFINTTDGRVYRNVTGICDNTTLMERFNKIANTTTSNAHLGNVLHNMQFAPVGVLCLSAPMIYIDPEDTSKVLNNTGAIGVDLLNDPKHQYLARESIKEGYRISIVGPRKLIQCPDCGLYFIVRIPIVSTTYSIEIDNMYYDRWGFATALIQWEKLVDRSNIRETFITEQKDFQLTRTDRIYNTTTSQYDTTVVVLAQSDTYKNTTTKKNNNNIKEITHILQTTNNEWQIAIQYSTNNQWFIWAILICLFVAVCISVLTYVVLLQKFNQNIYKSEAMVHEAKVDIERNMTAFFAHELRNPLSAIDSAILSMPDNIPDDAKELLHGMQLCSTFMSSIMNNLLDVRKMEEGKLIMHQEPFSLSTLVTNLYTMTLPTVKSGVELFCIAETYNNDWVIGDIHRLEQIMYNLISNAIKYTRTGSITIYVGWENNNRTHVRFECRDTGPGIPKEEQESMFDRFTQRGGAPGSGLGLAIAKNLVTLMDGTVYFDSDPTIRPGTTCIVTVRLPSCPTPIHDSTAFSQTDTNSIDECNPGTSTTTSIAISSKTTTNCTIDNYNNVRGSITNYSKENWIEPIQEPIRILIVDDIKMNRNLLRRRFEKSISPNCIVSEGSTGEETIEFCTSPNTTSNNNNNTVFDVIIMDQYMHDAGGVMLGTDTIIALRRMKVQSYIIGCSGNDLDDKFYNAGADLIWKKPLPSNNVIIQQLRTAIMNKQIIIPPSSVPNGSTTTTTTTSSTE